MSAPTAADSPLRDGHSRGAHRPARVGTRPDGRRAAGAGGDAGRHQVRAEVGRLQAGHRRRRHRSVPLVKNLSESFPELVSTAAAMIPAGCIIDGEAVVWIDGRLSFDALQQRLSVGADRARRLALAQPASYVGLDVLAVAGRDVRHLRFDERRSLLEQLAAEWSPPLNLSPVTADIEEAQQWMETMTDAGIEGIIAKGADQPYVGGARSW
ncbi:hypothetical protein [Agromyces sp. NPDC049794]|uniref:ATP-dependent DNA ligase n=1 Tax=unclassified Agromyces TaxID=2639701 RepID=UPI0034019C26